MDYKKRKVAELKEELGSRGLSQTGKKDELIARLLEADAAAPPTSDSPAPDALADAAPAAPAPAEDVPAADVTVAPSAEDGEDICGDGGLFKKVTHAGDPAAGTPPKGAEVWVHYTGRLLDGSKFDSSVDRNAKFTFTIGSGQVIKGWDKGVATMHKGEKAVLTCREDYAYGKKDAPRVEPATPHLSGLEPATI